MRKFTRLCVTLAVALFVGTNIIGAEAAENRMKRPVQQMQPTFLNQAQPGNLVQVESQVENVNNLVQSESAVSTEALSQAQAKAWFFDALVKKFAQQDQSLEEQYLQIAKKLVELKDLLPDLEKCMEQALEVKYGVVTPSPDLDPILDTSSGEVRY